MLHSLREHANSLIERIRARFGERLTAVLLALLLEAVLVLAILSLGLTDPQRPKPGVTLTSVDIKAAADKAPEHAAAKPKGAARPLQQPQPQVRPSPQQPALTPTAPQTPAFIPLSRNQLAVLDISNLPRQPSAAPAMGKGMMGPVDMGVSGDSKRVGTAPNGQPMYAAAWYREPSDEELRGYLQTADPGYALITCRTVPDFKVDDCEGLDQYPSGSNMLRAVLAAAWQFKVRPPRVGGVSQVGAWVRIRIEYTVRRN